MFASIAWPFVVVGQKIWMPSDQYISSQIFLKKIHLKTEKRTNLAMTPTYSSYFNNNQRVTDTEYFL
jgi:hypothetical protein